jgi:hypothetical protein
VNVYIKNAVLIGLRQFIVVFGVWLAKRGLTLSEDQQEALANIIAGVALAVGAFVWSNVAKRVDQKSPDPAKSPVQNFTHLPVLVLPLLLIVGCTVDDAAKAERIALQIKAATTQPTAQIIVQSAPATAPIVAGIGAGASLAALVFGWFARRPTK